MRAAKEAARLIFFAWQLSKCGCLQASRVTFTRSCRCDNSCGDDFARHFGLAGLIKPVAGSLERFTHRRNHLRFERSGSYEWTNWHGRSPPAAAAHAQAWKWTRGIVKCNRGSGRLVRFITVEISPLDHPGGAILKFEYCRRSGAPPHIGCCRCMHRMVPISGKPEIGCGEHGTHNH